MANPLTPQLVTGTIGELLAQLRLLQYGVQAAPPLKDTGNDLIALRGWITKCVQVKTTAGNTFNLNNLPEKYHFVLLVKLEGEGDNIFLDRTEIFLLTKEEIAKNTYSVHELTDKVLSQAIIDRTFEK
jgi:hypothetical protein